MIKSYSVGFDYLVMFIVHREFSQIYITHWKKQSRKDRWRISGESGYKKNREVVQQRSRRWGGGGRINM
jgi:hypothetical protein